MNGFKMASVRLSDLMEHDRMDAGFVIALVHLREATAKLRVRYTAEQAVALLDALPVQSKSAMSVLKRGSMPRPMTNVESHTLAVEYPHLALALVQQEAEQSIDRIRNEIARSSASLERLLELSSPDGSATDEGLGA